MHAAGATMAVGNGYASRVNALYERTQDRDLYLTSREQVAPKGGGNRYYPGSEKIHGRLYDRFDSQSNVYEEYALARPASAGSTAGRWRR